MVEHPFDIAPGTGDGAGETADDPPRATATPRPRDGREAHRSERDVRLLASSSSGRDPPARPRRCPRSRSTCRPPPGWDRIEIRPGMADRRSIDSRSDRPLKDDQVLTAAWTQTQESRVPRERPQRKLDLNIPPQLPGSEAPRIVLPTDRAAVRRGDRPHLSGAAAPAGRAQGAAGARRKAVHAGRLPAPGRRQQPDAPPGGLGRRGGQGRPDPGEDLPQPRSSVPGGPVEQQQHGRRPGRCHRPADHHGRQNEARGGRRPDEPGQRGPGPEEAPAATWPRRCATPISPCWSTSRPWS